VVYANSAGVFASLLYSQEKMAQPIRSSTKSQSIPITAPSHEKE